MNQKSSTTLDVVGHGCPTTAISVELPLATVEELDHLAELHHLSRRQLLKQLITTSLLNDAPHLPAGEDPAGRLAEHGYLTHRRSLEIAAEQAQGAGR